MFFGEGKRLEASDGSLQLQAVEITEGRIILRLRDTHFVDGPRGTKSAAAVGPHWVLEDGSEKQYLYEQASAGGGPFQGLVDIAFRVPEGVHPGDVLVLRSPDRVIRFTL